VRKISEPKTMRTLHTLREEHYRKTKNLSFDELMRSIETEARAIAKEHNFKLKTAVKR
jgi:hypothetical protein